MAQTDLTGLLTGVGRSPISPMAGMNREGRMAQRAQGFADRTTRGMLSVAGKDPRTLGQQAQAALAELDINNPDHQPKIMEIVKRVDPARAAQIQAQIGIQQKERDTEGKAKTKAAAQRTQFAAYLDKTYPELDLGALAEAGTITPQNLKDFLPALTKQGDRYKVVGSSVFDTVTEKFMAGPAAKGNPKDDILTVNDRLYSISAGDFITDSPTEESKKTE